MVYIRNICQAHEELAEEEIIELHFDYENVINIFKDDELEKCNGDLKITRASKDCSLYVDTAFVKHIIIFKEHFL